MNLTKLAACLSVLLKLAHTLRLLKKGVAAAILLLLFGSAALLLLQRKGGKKALRRAVKRVIG